VKNLMSDSFREWLQDKPISEGRGVLSQLLGLRGDTRKKKKKKEATVDPTTALFLPMAKFLIKSLMGVHSTGISPGSLLHWEQMFATMLKNVVAVPVKGWDTEIKRNPDTGDYEEVPVQGEEEATIRPMDIIKSIDAFNYSSLPHQKKNAMAAVMKAARGIDPETLLTNNRVIDRIAPNKVRITRNSLSASKIPDDVIKNTGFNALLYPLEPTNLELTNPQYFITPNMVLSAIEKRDSSVFRRHFKDRINDILRASAKKLAEQFARKYKESQLLSDVDRRTVEFTLRDLVDSRGQSVFSVVDDSDSPSKGYLSFSP